MKELSTSDLKMLIQSFLKIDDLSPKNLRKQYKMLKAAIPQHQEIDFFGLVCQQEFDINEKLLQIESKLLTSPLHERKQLKIQETIVKKDFTLISQLREFSEPTEEHNLRGAIHFINKIKES